MTSDHFVEFMTTDFANVLNWIRATPSTMTDIIFPSKIFRKDSGVSFAIWAGFDIKEIKWRHKRYYEARDGGSRKI